MLKYTVRFKPQNFELEAEQGTSLLKAAAEAGLRLETDCGGMGRCGKCKVVVHRGATPLTPREREYLTPFEIRNKVRLACQAFIRAATVASLPLTPIGEDRILEEGIDRAVTFQPAITKYYLDLLPADFKREASIGKIITDSLLQHGIKKPLVDFYCLKTLPLLLHRNTTGVTALVINREVLGFEVGETTGCHYGLAVDIGTTTVVGYLFDLTGGRLLGVDSALNRQSVHGSDVVSRIEYALTAPEGLSRLQEEAYDTINRIIDKLCYLHKISTHDIYSLLLVGNTAMNHLFWGISPRFLSRYPYNPLTVSPLCVAVEDTGLKMNRLGRVYYLPLVSAFMGSDTVGVVLSTGLHKSRIPRLAIDIGTNGEIVLTDGKNMVACSCAAGPAFEGAHIQCGMRGSSGAIDRVYLAGDEIRYHVIDEIPPKGICGSGLVDAVAMMLAAGLITPNGKLQGKEEIANPVFARRLTREKYNQIVLTGHYASDKGKKIVITLKDISELQLAKGAMRAGIKILMDQLGLADQDIREVYLAGGFGNYVRPESAVAIGLLPVFKKAKITPVGNAAGSGAKMTLLSIKALREAIKIAEQIKYVELANSQEFHQEFAKGVLFPK
ncbi:MAG: DUF4445 domain-containing protein [Deltaproteobacteria bacterium]|nr:MAG: DUF4445 domain-containing protein [Deltaproteobacteria bacterium]